VREQIVAGGERGDAALLGGRPGVALRTAARTVAEDALGAMLAKLLSAQIGAFDR
jgi:hypothetical protein